MDNTPTFLPTQTYLVTDNYMKNAIVFVTDTDYIIHDTIFYKVSFVCYEGRPYSFVKASSLIKYEFFPEDEEI